jgi:hypothetical protein
MWKMFSVKERKIKTKLISIQDNSKNWTGEKQRERARERGRAR